MGSFWLEQVHLETERYWRLEFIHIVWFISLQLPVFAIDSVSEWIVLVQELSADQLVPYTCSTTSNHHKQESGLAIDLTKGVRQDTARMHRSSWRQQATESPTSNRWCRTYTPSSPPVLDPRPLLLLVLVRQIPADRISPTVTEATLPDRTIKGIICTISMTPSTVEGSGGQWWIRHLRRKRRIDDSSGSLHSPQQVSSALHLPRVSVRSIKVIPWAINEGKPNWDRDRRVFFTLSISSPQHRTTRHSHPRDNGLAGPEP